MACSSRGGETGGQYPSARVGEWYGTGGGVGGVEVMETASVGSAMPAGGRVVESMAGGGRMSTNGEVVPTTE